VPRPIAIFYLDDMVQARYVRITFTDADNPDGYFEVGRLFCCPYTDLGYGFSEIRHGAVDDSDFEFTKGGQMWAAEIAPRETITLTHSTVIYTDKWWTLKNAIRKLRSTQGLILDCFPDGLPSESHFSTLYCRLQEAPEISQTIDNGFYQGVRVSETELIFEEML
jgi:hypothetical protein